MKTDREFACALHRILLFLSTDGVNPWKGSLYTMWPLLFKVLNLPPHLASQTNLLLLGGIIHGPTAPSNIQPYLLVLVDELLLHSQGVETRNPLDDMLRARICVRLGLLGGDFPATCKLLNVQGTAAVWACPVCYEQGSFSPGLKRMVYGGYRRFLPCGHSLRGDGETERDVAPPRRTTAMAIQDAEVAVAQGSPYRGAKGPCALTIIPTYDGRPFDVVGRTCFDLVHVFKEVGSHLFKTMKGARKVKVSQKPIATAFRDKAKGARKSKSFRAGGNSETPMTADSKFEARLAAWERDVREQEANNRRAANWGVKPKDRQAADRRWRSLGGLPGFVKRRAVGSSFFCTCTPRVFPPFLCVYVRVFPQPPFARTGVLKIHDWHVFFVTDAGKFILYNLLPEAEYKIVCGLINSVRALLRRNIDVSGFRLFFFQVGRVAVRL